MSEFPRKSHFHKLPARLSAICRLEYLVALRIMNRTSKIMIGVFLTGVLIVILPDHGARAFTFNSRHGPSWTDLAGLILVFISWFAGLILIHRKWNAITGRIGKSNAHSLLAIYLLAISGIVAALIFSVECLLWILIAVASIINIFFLISALKANSGGIR